MPEPDNTKMEELLRAYAKKRQDDSGGPLDLHPATRRLLHGEVQRVFKKASAAPGMSWHHLLIQFWPRFAFAAVVMLAVGGTLWMLNRQTANETALTLAKNEPATDPAV